MYLRKRQQQDLTKTMISPGHTGKKINRLKEMRLERCRTDKKRNTMRLTGGRINTAVMIQMACLIQFDSKAKKKHGGVLGIGEIVLDSLSTSCRGCSFRGAALLFDHDHRHKWTDRLRH